MVYENIIFMDEEQVYKLNLTQAEINFLFLHEIAHAGECIKSEKKADKVALELAKKYGIKVDWEDFFHGEKENKK